MGNRLANPSREERGVVFTSNPVPTIFIWHIDSKLSVPENKNVLSAGLQCKKTKQKTEVEYVLPYIYPWRKLHCKQWDLFLSRLV